MARAATGMTAGFAGREGSRSRTADAGATAVSDAGRRKARLAVPPFARPALQLVAALLVFTAMFLPLWGMTLVSIQYPEGLRMIVYPTRLVGDLAEINALNRYIGMAQISAEYFGELRVIAASFGVTAALCVLAAVVRRWWSAVTPLAVMAATAIYGFWRMRVRLYQYGHDLDPMAPIDIAPFTPPMFGENQIAQFGTYAYFSWGTILPVIAALLVSLATWMEFKRPPPRRVETKSITDRLRASTREPGTNSLPQVRAVAEVARTAKARR